MSRVLVKIARDLNVGTATIVEHLNSKGFDIENKPNAKITDGMYDELTRHFQKSIEIKDAAKNVNIGSVRPKPEVAEHATPAKEKSSEEDSEPKSEVESESHRFKLQKPVVLGKIDLSERLKQRIEKTTPSSNEPVNKRKEETPTPIEEKPVPREEVPAPIEEKRTPEPAKEKPLEPQATVISTPPSSEIPTANTPEAKTAPTTEVEAPNGNGGDNFRAETPELRGLKILGKIDTDKFERPRGKKPEKGKDQGRGKGGNQPGGQQNRGPATQGQGGGNQPGQQNRGPATQGQGGGNNPGGNQNRDNRGGDNRNRPNNSGQPNSPDNPNRRPQTEGGGGSNPPGNALSEAEKKKRKRKRKKVTPGQEGQGGAQGQQGQGQNQGGDNRGGGQGQRPQGGGNNNNNNNNNDRRPQHRPNQQGNSGGNRPATQENNGEVSQRQIEEKIKATMARLSGGGKKKRQKLQRDKRDRFRERQEILEQEAEGGKLQVTEFISVSELASVMNVGVTEVITTCLSLGVIVSINQRLDAEIIELVASEFGHEVEFISVEDQVGEEIEAPDAPETLRDRAPIVTVMGHVDHGKTSLLDYIRKANVVSGEAGGITQHIGAYEVELEDHRKITFLDTPGHEAFTAMRARGAKVTDIAIIIVAADDSIMPQTREAISHAQAAGVPMVFAINKVDKAGARPEKIKEELANMNILVEDWGGKFQSQDISAKTGHGIPELMEKILLEAELLELKANPNRRASGTVLEATLDKGRGYVTKMLVQNGTLKVGDTFVAGEFSGKVRAMLNERGKRVTEAGPATPVMVLGLSGAPQAGDLFKVYENDQEARQIASKRSQITREQANRATKRISLDEIGRRLALGNFKELNLIVKGDVDGSVEALADSLIKLSIESVQVNVIHKAVGQIIEADILLASASDAIIIGFQVRPSASARKVAEREGVEVKTYSIIYEAIEEVKAAIEGMLEPTKEEKITGLVEIREVYKISKVGTIAGCLVSEGKITRNSHIRVVRDGIVVFPTREGAHGEVASLKRFKEDQREVKAGLECGLSIKNFNDIKEGDVIEAYEIVEIKQKLS
ncbi:MAG: translation initiation factor IF-2 [Haliscomenobacter sp.]|uniref:translation initiation factor IF-2 n=1 Tax=Haliscomenobacter sp. TaxID=2717303 RepID=UPI0029A1155E|nr:translation initiation factor IF-2 [Haliscomenobacter sp.]MDX2069081.1 translation initiation factor IF-2 [Haliscomenobacter sp.]